MSAPTPPLEDFPLNDWGRPSVGVVAPEPTLPALRDVGYNSWNDDGGARVAAGISVSVGVGGFKCVVSGSDIRVYYGAVNSLLTDGMTYGDVPAYTITPVASAGLVCLAVVVSTSGVDAGTAIQSYIQTFASAPADSEPIFYLQIGTFNTVGGSLVVTPGGAGNGVGDQSFELCGGLGGVAQWGPA